MRTGRLPGHPRGRRRGRPGRRRSRHRPGRNVTRDLVAYRSGLEIVKDAGTVRYEDIGLDVGRRVYERYAAVADDFTSVSGESTWTMRFRRDDWDVRVVTHTVLRSGETEFSVDATLDGYENDRRVFSRTWNETVPRDYL